MIKTIDKNALRDMLAGAVEEKLQQDPDAVTLYAPVAPVTRRPWQSKPTPSELAFQEELQRIKQGASESDNGTTSSLDDFSRLEQEVKSFASRHSRNRHAH